MLTTPLLIIGTGFSGLGLAIRLRKEGREDFVVLERGNEVGGTWRDNVYPGCACDVQSHLYSFSFAPNPNWSRNYSPQGEILDYLKSCADRFDVRRFIRFETTVRSMRWADGEWKVETSRGEWRAKAVVMGVGPLSEPSIPVIPGLSTFEGPVFHSAEWDQSFDPIGKRVAVIGNGASAVQFIPILQKQVAHLTLFQRTASWVVPRPNRVFSSFERSLFRLAPPIQKTLRAGIFWTREILGATFRRPAALKLLERVALYRLKKDVPDPVLRAKLTPSYTMGCKRILLSDEFWPALAQPNVDVVTEGIQEIRSRSIITRDGSKHEADALIFATGFRVLDSPFYSKIFGLGGDSLMGTWEGSPRAYLGLSTHGFPNLFFLLGPNSGLGHTSVVLMIEAQIEHLLKVLGRLREVKTIEVRQAAQTVFVNRVDHEMKSTVWATGGCQSWYLDRTGRNSTIWPKSVVSFQKLLHSTDLEGYQETR
jgi:cation diffusion facilitator CzcD-associated flavoprotein CzcO